MQRWQSLGFGIRMLLMRHLDLFCGSCNLAFAVHMQASSLTRQRT